MRLSRLSASGSAGNFRLDIDRNDDFLDRLAYLDELRRASFGVRLQFATFGPIIGLVVMIDVAEQ